MAAPGTADADAGKAEETSPQTLVCKSAALGDLDTIKKTLEQHPGDLINDVDEQGHPPLHWAALNNHVNIVQYLLSNGASIHLINAEGATALHWAVVRNSLSCIEILLRAGAQKHAKDSRGYQPVHIAAQYGHTAALYHLVLRWNCDFNSLDNENRTPLHWAAYKGFHDLVRLLLVLGCDPSAQDTEGCNSLHWASIRGNSEAATILIQAGGLQLLGMVDKQGNTPSECARNGNHSMLSHHLNHEERRLTHRAKPKNKVVAFITNMHFAPVIWGACIGSVAVFFLKVLGTASSRPRPAPWMLWCAMLLLVEFGLGLVLMAAVNASDPGYVPRRGERRGRGKQYAQLTDSDNLDCPALWAGNWEQLCVTCKVVRPLRSKHDPISGRCIEVFDHFCPWVGNAVGKGNRHLFIMFILNMLAALLLAYTVTFGRLSQVGFFDWGPRHRAPMTDEGATTMTWCLAWLVGNIPLVFPVMGLAGAQVMQTSQNMTTNELQNWPRYKHFRKGEGKLGTQFTNPFDKGIFKNCHETCCPDEYPVLPGFIETEDMERVRKELDKLPVSNAGASGRDAAMV